MEPIRCHFTIILERLFRIYWQLLPALVIPLLSGGLVRRPGLFLLAFGASFVIFTAWQAAAWWHTRLSADDEQLHIQRGIVWKRQLAIPFSKVNTVDLSRNLFQRAVGTCRIKIDTGAVTGKAKGDPESDLVFTLAEAERIRACILSLSTGVASLHNEFVDLPEGADAAANARPVRTAEGLYRRADTSAPAWTGEAPARGADAPGAADHPAAGTPRTVMFRARKRDFFLYGLTQNKVLAGFAIFTWLTASAGELFGDRVYDWLEGAGRQAGAYLSRFELVAMIIVGLVLFLAYYVLINVATVLYAVVRFYGFRVSREGELIHIEYGLLSVRSYTMPLRNIHAVIIRQNLLRQMLGQCSVELVSIGYGDDRNEVALLFPLIPRADMETALGRILAEYQGARTRVPSPAPARRFFLVLPVALLLLATALASFIVPRAWLSLAASLPVLVWTRLLYHRHAAIGYDEDRVEVATGGFNYREYRIRMAAVQSVSAGSTWITERAGLKSYRIDYHAPALRAAAHVRFLAGRHLAELRGLLDR